ncbi:MAG: hypothetical protein ACE5FN_06120 [Leptospirillia bacterium]
MKPALAKFLMVVFSTVVTVSVAEVGARLLFGPPGPHTTFLKSHLELLADLPDTEREQFIADYRTLRQRAFTTYHDYHLFSIRQLDTETIGYIGPMSARRTPDSIPMEQADLVVWMFGGSTMQNFELPDQRTIANLVARNLQQAGRAAHVVNYGVGTFQSSLELIKFQSLIARNSGYRTPDIAVFYDGYNDADQGYQFGAGVLQQDLRAKLSLLVGRDHGGLLRYGAAMYLSERFRLFELLLFKVLAPASIFDGNVYDSSPANLDHAVDIYRTNTDMIRASGKALGIKTLFLLQPLVVTKEGLSDAEQAFVGGLAPARRTFVRDFYERTRATGGAHDDFVDLSGGVDQSGNTDFFDLGHIGPKAAEPIARGITEAILVRINAPASP